MPYSNTVLKDKDTRFPRRNAHIDVIQLSEGILLSSSMNRTSEKAGTKLNLLVRAFFLFAIVTGSLGGMLSAFNISYTKWAFFLTAFLASLYCASLYLAVWWENAGYILIFIVVLNAGIGLRTYISSGFYGILNDIAAAASAFFGSDAQISYVEQVANHSLAISISMCYFALIGCIITNGLISRKTKYIAAAAPALIFLLVPIYLEHEPAGGYTILLAVGILTVYIFRQNQYLCHCPKRKLLRKAAKKHMLLGNFSSAAALGTLLAVALLCSIVVGAAGLLIPRTSYMDTQKNSSLKLQTMDTMENFYLLGVMGLINFYPTTGGLVNGRLGGVSSVRLDYETDLTLEFVPYTYDRIYLKTFVGAEYIPYENHWSIQDETAYAEGWNTDTAGLLEQAFLSGAKGYARGVMNIKNVAAMTGVYLPYYSKDTRKIVRPGAEQSYTFYPLLTDSPEGQADPPVSDCWLAVPEENRAVIADFCAEAGLCGSPGEVIEKLRDYFQQNFPYTLSPGATPRRKDFVNYFLTEKRKGYCAHYATSAVLILRYMDIPARYVEGYAVDAMEIAEEARRIEGNVSDFYEGASLLSGHSLISYDASDGNAHAWVEIYDENTGWYPIELTPYITGQEENRTSLWDMFASLFRTETNAENTGQETQTDTAGAAITEILRTSADRIRLCLLVLIITIPVWLLVRKGMRLYHYRHADRSEKLLIQYRDLVRKISYKSRPETSVTDRHKKLSRPCSRNRSTGTDSLLYTKSFEEQIDWFAEHGFLPPDAELSDRLIRILNEAAFSRNEISEEVFAEARLILKSIKSKNDPDKS